MNHCQRFEPLLALHVEEDLPTEESAAVERHLAECADCRRDLAALVESQAFFLEVRRENVPDAAARQVRRRVLDRIEQNPGRVLGWPVRIERAVLAGVRRPLAIATTCGLALLAALVWMSVPAPVVVDEPVFVVEAPDVDDVEVEAPPPVTSEPAVELEEVTDAEIANTEHGDAAQPAVPVAIDWIPAPVEIDVPAQRTVKLVTDNPQVIIYWVLEEGNEGGGA